MTGICLYCLVFTLDDKANKYVDMFLIWLHFVMRYGELTEQDSILVFVDPISLSAIQQHEIFRTILQSNNQSQPKFQFITITQPKTLMGGVMNRYHICDVLKQCNIINKIVIYSDIDNLFVKPIKSIIPYIDLSPSVPNLVVLTEGTLTHSNYWGAVLISDDIEWINANDFLRTSPGFSSGLFAFSYDEDNNAIETFFNNIYNNAKLILSLPPYTLDQPFFNDALVTYMYKKKDTSIEVSKFRDGSVATNILYRLQDLPDEVSVINFCGEPGNQQMHWDKLFTQLYFTI